MNQEEEEGVVIRKIYQNLIPGRDQIGGLKSMKLRKTVQDI